MQKIEDNIGRICASGEVDHGPFMVQHVSHIPVIVNIFSNITSNVVWIVLATSKNSSGMVNDSPFGSTSSAEGPCYFCL